MADGTWLWAHDADTVEEEPRPHFHCERCGTRTPVDETATPEELSAAAAIFAAEHRNCAAPYGREPE